MDLRYNLPTQKINYKKIFLLADIHAGVRANSIEWMQNIEYFFKEFYIPYLKKNIKPGDVFFCLGDAFDNRQLLDIAVMNMMIDTITALADILPCFFLTGNHDIYKKNDTDVNSLAAFRFIPNVTIYEKPTIVTDGLSRILLLPWIATKEEEEGYLENNLYDYVFAHTDMLGFQYDNSRQISKGIDIGKAKNLKRLFSGHIHRRQEMSKFIYIGSPYHTKRSDIGNDKGVYLFDPASNEIEFTLNTISSIFQKVQLSSILELTLEQANKVFQNNYTDIIVPDKYIHIFNLTKFIDALAGCEYKKIETVGEARKIENDFIGLMDGIDIKDILSLIEMSINDLGHQTEVLVKLKSLNKSYYDRANREDMEN